MVTRVLVIGGDAAGASAASAVKKDLGDEVEVVVLERGGHTSYSACGIPYWVGGDIQSAEDLVARSPSEHVRNGLDVRMGVEATSVDTTARTVTASGPDGESTLEYDHLVVATGAEPIRPDLPGIDAAGIWGVQDLDDGQRVIDDLDAASPRRAVVVGSGYIGLEMAEACVQRGLDVTVVEQAEAPMPLLAADLGEVVRTAMEGMGIRFVGKAPVTGFESSDGRVSAVVTEDETFDADVVILGLGVSARSGLASDAGLATGMKAGIVTDAFQRAEGAQDVWAAGDCVVSHDRLTGDLIHLPLGTHANKQGLVAGRAIAATVRGQEPTLAFPGVLRTAITKICNLEISLTGLDEEAAAGAGFDPVVASIESTTTAGYFPGAEQMTVRVVADRGTRRLLGGQIVGRTGSAWRVDTLAMALWNEMTVDDLAMTDLSYAPPFSSVWDPVQVAARSAVKQLEY